MDEGDKVNDREKIAKLVGYIDTLARCEDLLESICEWKDPEDLRSWEDDTLAEIQELTRKTIDGYKKERESYLK